MAESYEVSAEDLKILTGAGQLALEYADGEMSAVEEWQERLEELCGGHDAYRTRLFEALANAIPGAREALDALDKMIGR